MTTHHVDIAEQSVEKLNVWLKELCDELGTDDRRQAYRVLRAFLHTLRDRLTVDAVAAAARVLRRHVSPGELDDVLGILPRDLRTLVTDA